MTPADSPTPPIFPKCNQQGCAEDATFRFTWPGKDESHICVACVPKLQAVCNAIGLYVQIRPIDFAALVSKIGAQHAD